MFKISVLKDTYQHLKKWRKVSQTSICVKMSYFLMTVFFWQLNLKYYPIECNTLCQLYIACYPAQTMDTYIHNLLTFLTKTENILSSVM